MIDTNQASRQCNDGVRIMLSNENHECQFTNYYTQRINTYTCDIKTKTVKLTEKTLTNNAIIKWSGLKVSKPEKNFDPDKLRRHKEFNVVELNIPNLGFKINISSDTLLKTYASPEIIKFCKDLAEKRGLELSEVLEINANSQTDEEFEEKINEATKDHGKLPVKSNDYGRGM